MEKILSLPRSTVAEYASSEASKFFRSDALDVTAMVAGYGGRVVVRDGAESLAVASNSQFIIFTPSHLSERSTRLFVARELGRFLLFYLADETVSGRHVYSFSSSAMETPTLYLFALFALMPKRRFEEALKQLGVKRTAAVFNVSEESVKRRYKMRRQLMVPQSA